MLNPANINDTQYLDESCGLLFPWFTKPMLDVLKAWDLKDKRVYEYGGGYSTLWWAHHCKEITTVESDLNWITEVASTLVHLPNTNYSLIYAPVVGGEVELKSMYVQSIYQVAGEFDIIIIDGSYRDECIAAALTKIKDGGIIICDNWDQEGVWDSIMGARLLDPWEAQLFIEPSRAGDARPWKTGYWVIHKNAQHLLAVTDDYSSHRPMLWMALEHIKPGVVVELGCGYGSTLLLDRYCDMQERPFVSLETNKTWADQFGSIVFPVDSYAGHESSEDTTILFIDSAPGEQRADLLKEYADKATVLIVHDTEPGAEYVYHIQDALNSFKYRCDLVIDGHPQTTAVSNVYDFERWKGLTLGNYTFILTMKPFLLFDPRRDDVIHLGRQLYQQRIDDFTPVQCLYGTTPEEGINLSHKSIVQRAKDAGLMEACILEADVMFPALDGWQYFLNNKPQDFDLYLGGVYGLNATARRHMEPGVEVHNFAGLHCYIIHSKFYDKFLSVPSDRHIDIVLAGMGKYIVCYPFAALQRPGFSANNRDKVDYNTDLKPGDVYTG